MAAFYGFSTVDSTRRSVDKDALIDWAAGRFGTNFAGTDFTNMPKEEVIQTLVKASEQKLGIVCPLAARCA